MVIQLALRLYGAAGSRYLDLDEALARLPAGADVDTALDGPGGGQQNHYLAVSALAFHSSVSR